MVRETKYASTSKSIISRFRVVLTRCRNRRFTEIIFHPDTVAEINSPNAHSISNPLFSINNNGWPDFIDIHYRAFSIITLCMYVVAVKTSKMNILPGQLIRERIVKVYRQL